MREVSRWVPRRWLGLAVCAAALAAVTGVLLPLRDRLSLAGVSLVYLLPIAAAAATGGLWPALGGAVAAGALLNFLFVPPYRSLLVDSPSSAVVLVVYVLVAAGVAVAVHVAGRARHLAGIDRLRAALLDAVGHDLRTPLASVKFSVATLRSPRVTLSAADRDALLATAEESTDRLVDLVENLLSMSRLQAGVLSADPVPVALDAVVAGAVLHLPDRDRVELDIPEDLPLALADPGLLERVVANLLSNALAFSAVRVVGSSAAGRLRLDIVDRGPGLPRADRERAFAPFLRLDDRRTGGLGLGLAIARGFTEAMGGTLTHRDTDGGGSTMTIDLPAAP